MLFLETSMVPAARAKTKGPGPHALIGCGHESAIAAAAQCR
jgi:hypothetical protein